MECSTVIPSSREEVMKQPFSMIFLHLSNTGRYLSSRETVTSILILPILVR